MPWFEIKVRAPSHLADDLSSALSDKGAIAITIQDGGDQPIYEPKPGVVTPLWDEVVITGLFEDSEHFMEILATIQQEFSHLTTSLNTLEDQDWERAWMSDFKPMQFGQRLWIVPSYQDDFFSPHQVILDPGLAFGTGKHPTTDLCLQWLDKHIKGGEIVIDYGCGSGILGIAALKLGAAKVYAVDYDEQAILATKENAERNGISQQLTTCLPDHFDNKQSDILLANILANTLIDLAEKFSTLLRPSGQIVLSGILKEQTEMVINAYQNLFEIVHVAELEDWVRIDGRKIPSPA